MVESHPMDAATLPNDPEALKVLLAEQKEHFKARIEFLEERVRLLTQALFGRKSEKGFVLDPHQLHMFNEAEAEEAAPEEKPDEIRAHTRQKPKRKPLPEHLPRVEVVHDIPDKVCACGTPLTRIGEEVCEKLDIIPATVQVICHIRPKYACKGCEGVDSEGGAVKIAEPPPEMIPKGMATAGTLAYVATAKYADGLPLYRLSKILERHGIEIPRSTMSSWMVMAADRCKFMMELLHREIISGFLINADETPVQVMNEPGRKNTTESYMWVFRGEKSVLFHYDPTRSGDVPKEILKGYKGYLQTDAYAAYDQFDIPGTEIFLVGCMAHVRRNFVKVIEARGKVVKKTGSAEVALDYIRKLYLIEKFAREKELSPEETLELRKEQALLILMEFKAWMVKRLPQTPPKGLLGKALSYALNHWQKLLRYLDDGRIPIDNNIAENAIRPFVIGRKGWLFAGHPNGAHAAATLYSLIETAKACGLEPYHYLRYLFAKLPYACSEEDHQALLPSQLTREMIALP